MGYRGYISHVMQGGRSVPQSVQQLVIRNYCEKNNLEFLLSATEFEDQTIIFDSIKEKGVVFYSIWNLPADKRERYKIYNSGKDIRFASENIHYLDINLLETAFTIGEYHAGSEFPTIAAYLNKA